MKLKSVCLLLGMCYASSAAAIGLGELNVRSHLGQPLHATVKLLDITPQTITECFSLEASDGSITPPPRAQLQIEQRDGQALLHIRTPQSVNDPIAQFMLVYACEVRLQRDYVVLLDPPALVDPASTTVAAMMPQAAAAPGAATPVQGPARRAGPSRRQAAAALGSSPAPSTVARKPATPAPRLILSGKRHVAGVAGAAFALQLDTNLPDLTRPRPEGLTATELSDENTALTRKLAHLESQLRALQLRNAELEAKRTAKPAAVVPPPAQSPPQWPLYLLASGLLISSGTLVVWLRRRSRRAAASLDETPWFPHDTMDTMPAERETLPDTVPIPFPATSPTPERMAEIGAPAYAESTEVKDDILDQAEVYMAHGHGELAVHLLQEHLREAPTESPVPWLLLLDLLHREGNTAGYEAASAECRRHFNVNLSGHPISQDNEQGQGLEAYPHLLEQLVNVWNSPDIDDFFKDLIYDNRGGTRMGFEPGAYRDILLLRSIARDALPLAA